MFRRQQQQQQPPPPPQQHEENQQQQKHQPHYHDDDKQNRSEAMTMAVRPVTARFPTTMAVWQDTNLPLACVLTPLSSLVDDAAAPTPTFATTPKRSGNSRNPTPGKTVATSTRRRSSTSSSPPSPSLAVVAKCLHCGAPHPVASVGLSHIRHYQHQHQELLCFLCGKTSSTVWEDQHAARSAVEGWWLQHLEQYRDLYEKYPALTIASSPSNNNNSYYLNKNIKSQPSRSSPPYYHQCEYVIPLSSLENAAAIPAMSCPPLWIVVLDGTCPHRRYWQRVVHLLRRVLLSQDDEEGEEGDSYHDDDGSTSFYTTATSRTTSPPPTCLHLAILSLQADHTCAIWDLSSPVAHVLQQPLWSDDGGAVTTSTGSFNSTLLQRLVPVDALHTPHIATALRAMADMGPMLAQSSLETTGAGGTQRYSLAETLSAVLSWLEPCQLAGVDATAMHDTNTNGVSVTSSTTNTPVARAPIYAGGKVLCLLTSAPDEIEGGSDFLSRPARQPTGDVGRGGWGGSCASTSPGERWTVTTELSTNDVKHPQAAYIATNGAAKDSDPESGALLKDDDSTTDPLSLNEDDEMTPVALAQQYPNCQVNLLPMYTDLGQQYAQAGLGIDILFLLEQQQGGQTARSSTGLGLPFLKILSDTSGSPGPLLFAWDDDDDNDEVDARLEREVLARAPWGERVALGAELRVRLTPGWSVDHQSSTTDATSAPAAADQPDLKLATRYVRAGLMGPASSAGPSESTNLWRLGSCDPFTSLTIDLLMSNQKQYSHWMIEGFGEVKVYPVIQTCFAYNTIRKHESGSYYVTERRLRIACRAMPLANSAETLLSSLDCDALAVVLFHKLALASFQDGLMETKEIGQSWLRSLLLCAYRSAELQEARHGLELDDDEDVDDIPTTTILGTKTSFLPNERLLDREGDLSAADVLLAQGHDRLRHVPHLLYSLLQCDAFRSSSSTFRPTLDARCAASVQLSSMTPAALLRCISPRLDLWSSCDEQLIVDQLDLQWKSIVSIIEEQEFGTPDDDHLLLLLHCPFKAAVYDTQCLANGHRAVLGNAKVTDGLQQLMEESVAIYRVAPSIEFESPLSAADLALRLRDVLVEDVPFANGLKNFEEWKAEIAAMVHEELCSDGF